MPGSYVPGFNYDVFVSYAHVDDHPVVGAELGWVSTLQRNLFMLLDRRLGRRENYVPFTDHRLRGHDEIDSLLEAVRASATLVVVLSPGWSESTYCQKELASFIDRPVGNRPRDVFIVEMLKLTGVHRPKDIPNTRAYCFWHEDEAGHTHTDGYFDYKDPGVNYGKRLDELAQELADHLKALRSDAAAQPPTPSPVPGPGAPAPVPAALTGSRMPVVLAEVTDDLVTQRADVSRYLRDQNFEVLPEGTYRYLPPAEVEAAIIRDLGKSAGFVQLLSGMPGHTDDRMPFGVPWLQHQAAKKLGSRVVQWRKPDTDLDSIILPEYRALVSGETVREMPLPDFSKFVVDFLRPPPVVDFEYPGAIFINADQPDMEVARQFKEGLEREFPVVIPSAEDDPEELRRMIEDYLINCESLVMLYGTTKPTWIDRQLWRFNKLARNRERPPRLLAVLDIKMPLDSSDSLLEEPETSPDKPRPSVGLPGLTALSALGIEAGLTLLRQHLAA
jgi:hypothetical protein